MSEYKMPRKCYECGSESIEMRDLKGKTVPYREHSAVEIKSSYSVPTCTQCGNWGIRAGQAKDLDQLCEESLKGDA